MPKLIDLTGQKFGRLIVQKRGENNPQGKPRWLCRCSCGNYTLVLGYPLKSGKTQSCGCLQKERTGQAAKINSRTHGKSGTPEYIAWVSMRTRCNNPNATGYNRWGGRGIKICERWDDFSAFLSDMGERPTPQHTLDRIDSNGDYEPSNCRWASKIEQANNRRDNRSVTIHGVTMTLNDAIRRYGSIISAETAWRRVKNWGWPHEKAVSAPSRFAKR